MFLFVSVLSNEKAVGPTIASRPPADGPGRHCKRCISAANIVIRVEKAIRNANRDTPDLGANRLKHLLVAQNYDTQTITNAPFSA